MLTSTNVVSSLLVLARLCFFEWSNLSVVSAAKFAKIEKFKQSELTLEQFDSRYLNKAPVIISDASFCPEGVDLQNLASFCDGIWNVFVEGGSSWASLHHSGTASVKSFLKNLHNPPSQSEGRQYLFDVLLHKYCPGLVKRIFLPGYVAGVFAQQWAGNWSTCQLAHLGLYVSHKGFRSQLDVESVHRTFVASSCDGRKRWRIVTPATWTDNWSSFGVADKERGVVVDGKLVLANPRQPFETWNSSSRLNDMDVIVYQGIVKPGEMIYVPAGAPHAAEALDASFMLAVNGPSLQDLGEFLKACKKIKIINDQGRNFQDVRQLLPVCDSNVPKYTKWLATAQANFKAHPEIQRVGKSWLEAHRCNGTYCDELRVNGLLSSGFDCKEDYAERRPRKGLEL
eukprot:gnl/MRDRNA2_/MRDRNA2_173208_c0_seq1.p1 gnl/MRDRNA2_/MRDRNA2_173208_c0~~gnl/MRDRNA2_/MRDRNA2_173208_c0_seq1.p1  ORF type:complete len:398 (-),score=78.23 gnl/MRDRNA2_/MRDRNA2_173208_c0_seq1:51-1244(-)